MHDGYASFMYEQFLIVISFLIKYVANTSSFCIQISKPEYKLVTKGTKEVDRLIINIRLSQSVLLHNLVTQIGHFRAAVNLIMKARISAMLFI